MNSRHITVVAALFFCMVFTKFVFAEEVVYVVNNYCHSVPTQPDFSDIVMIRAGNMEIMDTVRIPGIMDAHSMAVTKGQNRLWVTCPNGYKIVIIDTASLEVVKTIGFGPIPFEPMGIALTPNGKRMYVLINEGFLFRYNAHTGDMIFPGIDLGSTTIPDFIVFNHAGTMAYIVDYQNADVLALRLSDHEVIETLDFEGSALQDAVVSPDDSRVYVCNMQHDRIEVIRTLDHTALAPIYTMYLRPRGIGISPDGEYLFVGHYLGTDSKVTMIEARFRLTIDAEDLPSNGRRLKVSPDGKKIFVSDHSDDKCCRFDVVANRLEPAVCTDLNFATLPGYTIGASPIGLAVAKNPPPAAVRPVVNSLLID